MRSFRGPLAQIIPLRYNDVIRLLSNGQSSVEAPTGYVGALSPPGWTAAAQAAPPHVLAGLVR
jgi:hypothetical protein